MNKQIEKLRSKLNRDLSSARSFGNPLERLNKISAEIEKTITVINKQLRQEGFSGDQEEITFFKQIKPGILALKIEEVFRYNLEVHKPIGTVKIQLKYFEEELKALQSFFRLNSYNYQYYKNKLTEMDKLYFMRNGGPLAIPLAEITEADMEFATPMTYLFAKFIAYEQLQYDMMEQIAGLKYPQLNQPQKGSDSGLTLKWTGDVINIIELAYGFYLTGQLNNGNASLNQIVRWLESNLGVSIGIAQRKFSEISRRKRISVTKFIDQMKEAILSKINTEYQ